MWERLTAPEDGFSKLQRENLAIIESYGKSLMEVVCRDACDGHEFSRVRVMHTYFVLTRVELEASGHFKCVSSDVPGVSSCVSDAGLGSAGQNSVYRSSESVAALCVQQWLPAVTGGEPETGRCRPAESAHASAAPP